MIRSNGARGVALAVGTVLALAAAAPARSPRLAALLRIEPGEWQFKAIGSNAAPQLVCVTDPAVLLHFKRSAAGCGYRILVDEPARANVDYHCAGGGSGRTTVRVATPRAFDLDLQGIAGGLPYDESYEAHRVGTCAAR